MKNLLKKSVSAQNFYCQVRGSRIQYEGRLKPKDGDRDVDRGGKAAPLDLPASPQYDPAAIMSAEEEPRMFITDKLTWDDVARIAGPAVVDNALPTDSAVSALRRWRDDTDADLVFDDDEA